MTRDLSLDELWDWTPLVPAVRLRMRGEIELRGWYFGTDRFESEGEFFRVTIDGATYW